MIVKMNFYRLRKIFDLIFGSESLTALLSRGTSTAGELSNISDVPRSRTYDILESLEKKGFIVMKIGKPIKFVALKPEEVIERVKKNLMVNAQVKNKKIRELKGDEVLEELDLLFTKGIRLLSQLISFRSFTVIMKLKKKMVLKISTLVTGSEVEWVEGSNRIFLNLNGKINY